MPKELSTDWTGVTTKDRKATVQDHKSVKGVMAIRVKKASIRLATVSDVFEIDLIARPFSIKRGKLNVEVRCGWYGRKPPTEWMTLILGKDWELLPEYTGKVAYDIYSKADEKPKKKAAKKAKTPAKKAVRKTTK
jgi:hypothetical protein